MFSDLSLLVSQAVRMKASASASVLMNGHACRIRKRPKIGKRSCGFVVLYDLKTHSLMKTFGLPLHEYYRVAISDSIPKTVYDFTMPSVRAGTSSFRMCWARR